MKTKRKEKEKKKGEKKEKKRSKEKKVMPGIELGTFDSPGHVEDTKDYLSKFYYKNLRALLNVNSNIFFRRMTAVSTVKT